MWMLICLLHNIIRSWSESPIRTFAHPLFGSLTPPVATPAKPAGTHRPIPVRAIRPAVTSAIEGAALSANENWHVRPAAVAHAERTRRPHRKHEPCCITTVVAAPSFVEPDIQRSDASAGANGSALVRASAPNSTESTSAQTF